MVDAMSAAIVSVRDGTSKQLDAQSQPDEVVTPEDAVDGLKLGRLLTRILSDLAALRRRFAPRRITFRDLVSTGTSVTPHRFRLVHRFGTPVEWWSVGLRGMGAATLSAIAEDEGNSDENTLAIHIYYPGTFSIRVEEVV